MADVRLIDANALIKHYSCVEAQKSSAEKIRAEIIVQALENAPTIDPKSLQPVGRRVKKYHENPLGGYCAIHCPFCDRRLRELEDEKCCPGCGAKLKG